MLEWSRRRLGYPNVPNMQHDVPEGGQGNPAAHLFRDLGAVWALIGPKLGAQGTPKTM